MLESLVQYFKNTRSKNSFYGLDGLRALAILLVLCHHGPKEFYNGQFLSQPLLLELFSPLFYNGRIGVDLFFVLSGFLIAGQLLKFFESGQRWQAIWRFFANRIFRILPAFYILLLFLQFGLPHIPALQSVPLLAPGLTYQDLPRLIWVQYLFMQDFWGSTLVPMFWSLGVEEKFYLMAPLLVGAIYLNFKNNRFLLLGSLLGLIFVPALVRLYYLLFFSAASVQEHYGVFRFTEFHMRADGLLVGVLCAFLYQYFRKTGRLARPQTGKILLGLGSILALVFLVYLPHQGPYSAFNMQWSGLLIALGFGLMLLGVVLQPNEQAGWLGSKPLHYIARISYSLYITHFLWPAPLMVWLMERNSGLSWAMENGQVSWLFLLFMGLYLGISIVAATFYFYLVEKPFLLLKDRWFKAPVLHTSSAPLPLSRPQVTPEKDVI